MGPEMLHYTRMRGSSSWQSAPKRGSNRVDLRKKYGGLLRDVHLGRHYFACVHGQKGYGGHST